jgi:hypothetical protein
MAGPPSTAPITAHPALGKLDPHIVASGPAIPPIERVALFSEEQWEHFTDEWAASLTDYAKVERASGAGDKGCDIVAFPVEGGAVWDNYQCKHYDKPLTPTDIWVELGKICHYSFIGDYTVPRKYRFVAPRNIGTKLASYFRKPATLKTELLKIWDDKCKDDIKSVPAPLTAELREHIEKIDFGIFGYLPVLDLIEQHKKTPHFIARFGLGLPARSPVDPPPGIPTADETRYVQQLFEAYSDNKGRQITLSEDLPASLHKHFNRSRESFYSAEALRNFSRDNLPSGEFENLQEQIYTGVADTCEGVHACGLTRLIATTNRAADLSITSSPLMGKTEITDLHGICHQLANVDRLTWVVEKDGEDVDS